MHDANDEIEVKSNTWHKRWEHNAPVSSETIVLLELFEVLERRGRYAEEGSMTIGVDNRKAWNKAVNEMRKTNYHAQNTGAEIIQIKGNKEN